MQKIRRGPQVGIRVDVDLGEAIGDCLGLKLTYKPVTFAALLTTLQAGQADIVVSDIYAKLHPEAEPKDADR